MINFFGLLECEFIEADGSDIWFMNDIVYKGESFAAAKLQMTDYTLKLWKEEMDDDVTFEEDQANPTLVVQVDGLLKAIYEKASQS